jgi:hypothetical protein
MSWADAIKPRLTRNDVLSASDHPLHFIAQISRGSGYSQFGGLPLPVRSTFPISEAVYRRRSSAPWPDGGPQLARSEVPIEDIERQREAIAAEQKAKLEELLRQKSPPKA